MLHIPGERIAIDKGMMTFKGRRKNIIYSPMEQWGLEFYVIAESTTGYVYN